jgi:hypothetical protein
MTPIAVWLLLVSLSLSTGDDLMRGACEPAADAEPCAWVHGRLRASNGIGSVLWHIGTFQTVGLWYDDGPFPTLDRYHNFNHAIYADFLLCYEGEYQPGHMRFACVKAVRHVVVERYATDTQPLRVFHPTCVECVP